MDMLDRFLGHDAAASRELFVLSLGLSDEQLDRPLGVDLGTLRGTLEHVVAVMELWTDRMLGVPIRWRRASRDDKPSVADLLQRADVVAAEFAELARRVQAEGRLEDFFVDPLERNPRKRALGAGIGHVITHSATHRGHIAAMLERLGVRGVPEGDMLGWERELRGGWEPAG
jgi:uncharacterized damage-inducible protein DinB